MSAYQPAHLASVAFDIVKLLLVRSVFIVVVAPRPPTDTGASSRRVLRPARPEWLLVPAARSSHARLRRSPSRLSTAPTAYASRADRCAAASTGSKSSAGRRRWRRR